MRSSQAFKLLFMAVVLSGCFFIAGGSAAQAQIQFNRPKDADPLLDNPQTFAKQRDPLMETIRQVLKDMEIPIDEVASKKKPGILVTKPVIFTKGGNSGTNLEFVARRPGGDARNWLRGRYSLQIELSPLDPERTKMYVFARIEGECQEDLATKWVECPSRGVQENDFIKKLLKWMNEGPTDK